MATIAFIGLGHMGNPMACNLLKSGHTVKVFDVITALANNLSSQGAEVCNSIAEVVANVDAVITMLPMGEHVRSVYNGPNGIINLVDSSTLLIDSSTIDVNTARELNHSAESRGLFMVDAPVSGGTAGATAGTLTFMVGGKKEAYTKVKPILLSMGKAVIHAGQAGSGQAVKLCNNLILGVSMIAVAEAFNLASAVEMDKNVLFEILSQATAQCWALNSNCPVPGPVPSSPANNAFKPGFSAAMMLKDLRLVLEVAEKNGVAIPMAAEAMSLYTMYVNQGHGQLDFSGIINMLEGEIKK